MKTAEAAAMLNDVKNTITTQLRTCGVILHDDAGNLIRPHSGEEKRIVGVIARNVMQLIRPKLDCQTAVAGSDS